MFPERPVDRRSYFKRQLTGRIQRDESCTVDMSGFRIVVRQVFYLRTLDGLKELTAFDRVVLDISSNKSLAGSTTVKEDSIRKDNTFDLSWLEPKGLPFVKANAHVVLNGATSATLGVVHRFYKIEGSVHDEDDNLLLTLDAPLLSFTNEDSIFLGSVEGICLWILG